MRSEHSRPVCYLAIRNDQTRTAVEAQLARRGFEVIETPSGFHLLEALSGSILGDAPRPVDLVVVEERLPGCRGSSIAEGLRALGMNIPVAVVDAPDVELDRYLAA
jgi:DNA-binding response OmpR family regulator